MLSQCWNPGLTVLENISNFQAVASRRNHDSFGHIGRRKYSLLAHIRGIERINESSTVPVLGALEEQLKHELDEVLQQEELLWFQRLRSEWLADGDHNTKYYHRITKAKKRRNMCTMIKLEEGQWC
ncbi:hypothetical protein V6N11_040722 [Hibiscus sabdariffa]|uniref:Uncharacterized protein n=1 Tax=Hibiscus sabdariffa TaxID=183260 RepID=A0ABR2RIN3_9ROSI